MIKDNYSVFGNLWKKADGDNAIFTQVPSAHPLRSQQHAVQRVSQHPGGAFGRRIVCCEHESLEG